MSVLDEVITQINRAIDRFGGLDTLKAYGAMDWCHFIVNQLAYVKREQQESGAFSERKGPVREALLQVAALAIVGVMALDERNKQRDANQLHKDQK